MERIVGAFCLTDLQKHGFPHPAKRKEKPGGRRIGPVPPVIPNSGPEGAWRACSLETRRPRRASLPEARRRRRISKTQHGSRGHPQRAETGSPGSRRDAIPVAVRAFHEMDVVAARGGFEGRVHLLHGDAAVGQARMALGAGGASIHVMPAVAGKTAQALVHADARAIVSGTRLECVIRGVALVTDSLARVG